MGSPFFLSKNISLTVPKNFVEEHINVSEKFRYPKFIWIKRGCHYFLLKHFLSHIAKKLRGETLFCVKESVLSKIFTHSRGGHQVIVEKIFVPKDRNEKLG